MVFVVSQHEDSGTVIIVPNQKNDGNLTMPNVKHFSHSINNLHKFKATTKKMFNKKKTLMKQNNLSLEIEFYSTLPIYERKF
jgi:hypothetical protein